MSEMRTRTRFAELVWFWLLSPSRSEDEGYEQARHEIALLLANAGYSVNQYPHIPDPRADTIVDKLLR